MAFKNRISFMKPITVVITFKSVKALGMSVLEQDITKHFENV